MEIRYNCNLSQSSDVSRYVTNCYFANQRFIGYCSVAGKFKYQKKYDVNVCKHETSLYVIDGKSEEESPDLRLPAMKQNIIRI